MYRTTTERRESTTLERLVVRENSGLRLTSLKSIVVGYVVAGTKRLYHANGVTQCNEGDIFILGSGAHHEENIVAEQGVYEQITVCFDAFVLQWALCLLDVNYGVNLHSHHSCAMCEGRNATSFAASEQLSDLFVAVKSSMRNSMLLKNDVSLLIIFVALIYLMLSSGDNCLRHRLLRMVDSGKRRFLQIVHANIFRNITIEELASLTNRSLTTFKKHFRRTFGTTPHRWIMEQRLLRARIMLHFTSATVSEIAHQSGFVHASHFNKLFRHHFDITPCELRRRSQIFLEDNQADNGL